MRSCCHSLIRNRLLPCLISNKTMGERLWVQLLSPEIKRIQCFQLKPLSFMATLISLNCNRLFSQEKDCFVIFNCKELSQFISRKQHFNTANNSITITNKPATKTKHVLYMYFLKRSKHSMGMKCNGRKAPVYATNRSTAVNKLLLDRLQ